MSTLFFELCASVVGGLFAFLASFRAVADIFVSGETFFPRAPSAQTRLRFGVKLEVGGAFSHA